MRASACRGVVGVENNLHCGTGEFLARIRTLPPRRAELDGPLDEKHPHSSIGGSRAAGVGYSMLPLARLVFLDAAFSISSVRHLETLLSTKLDSSAANDLSASSTRASVDRRCVLGLGAASIGPRKFVRLISHRPLPKLRRVEIQARSVYSPNHCLNGESLAAGAPSPACLRASSLRRARSRVPASPKSTV